MMQLNVSVIILAAGTGSRMNRPMPKQFLMLNGKPVISYSLDLFCDLDYVSEIIIACDPVYRHLIPHTTDYICVDGGIRRQDSVWNAFQKLHPSADLVCIHDSARPLANPFDVTHVIEEAAVYGAAVLAVPVKQTIKEANEDGFVKQTLDRNALWEVQTPQVIAPNLLREGFAIAQERELTVTDDVALAELIDHTVKLVMGSYSNLKLTTEDDLPIMESLLEGANAQV